MSFDRRLPRLCARRARGVSWSCGCATCTARRKPRAPRSRVPCKTHKAACCRASTVTLTSRTQGNALTSITDSEGRFIFDIVRPDTYTLQAALQGFKTLEQTNLVVNANDRLSMPAS